MVPAVPTPHGGICDNGSAGRSSRGRSGPMPPGWQPHRLGGASRPRRNEASRGSLRSPHCCRCRCRARQSRARRSRSGVVSRRCTDVVSHPTTSAGPPSAQRSRTASSMPIRGGLPRLETRNPPFSRWNSHGGRFRSRWVAGMSPCQRSPRRLSGSGDVDAAAEALPVPPPKPAGRQPWAELVGKRLLPAKDTVLEGGEPRSSLLGSVGNARRDRGRQVHPNGRGTAAICGQRDSGEFEHPSRGSNSPLSTESVRRGR